MLFQFEVADDVVASVEKWLSTQLTVMPDPETGTPKHVFLHADIHDFFEKALANAAQQGCQMFPTETLRAQLIQQKQATEAFQTAIRPKSNRAASLRPAKAPTTSDPATGTIPATS
jgi:hypothetical protein